VREQAFRAEVDALKKEVDDLRKSKELGQELYHSTFSLLQDAKREIFNLQVTNEDQKVRIQELERVNPFVTPVKSGGPSAPLCQRGYQCPPCQWWGCSRLVLVLVTPGCHQGDCKSIRSKRDRYLLRAVRSHSPPLCRRRR
jgi:hypothetical protein